MLNIFLQIGNESILLFRNILHVYHVEVGGGDSVWENAVGFVEQRCDVLEASREMGEEELSHAGLFGQSSCLNGGSVSLAYGEVGIFGVESAVEAKHIDTFEYGD